MGGGCDTTKIGIVDYTPGAATAPTTPSAQLLACQTRFSTKVKALARFSSNKIHGCAEKVIKCKLASEIDAVDPTSCLGSAQTACAGMPTLITDKLAKFKDPSTTAGIPHKCGIFTYADLQPFVGG